MRFPEYPIAGEPIRASWGCIIIDYLRSITPRPSADIYPETGPNGTTFRSISKTVRPSIAQVAAYAKPFALDDLTENSFSVLRNNAQAGGLWLAGVMITTIAASGITFDTDRWESGTITAAKCVWLELDRQANAVTIYMGAAFPDGTAAKYDYTEIHPLWSIPWDEDNDVIGSAIIDMREAVRIPAMA
jgi:hypothetical protein